jgi:hypothetical protein
MLCIKIAAGTQFLPDTIGENEVRGKALQWAPSAVARWLHYTTWKASICIGRMKRD